MHWSKYQGGNCVLLYKVFYSSWWWFLIYHVLLFSPLAKASVYTHVSLVLTTQTSLLYNIVCCNIGFHLCLRSCQNRIPWCSVAEAIWPQHALAEQYGQRREWGHFLQRLQRIGKWVPSSAFDKFHMLESHFESSRPYVWSSVCIIWLCAKIQCSSTNQSRSVWNSGTFRGLQPLDTRKSEKLGERLCGVIWQLAFQGCLHRLNLAFMVHTSWLTSWFRVSKELQNHAQNTEQELNFGMRFRWLMLEAFSSQTLWYCLRIVSVKAQESNHVSTWCLSSSFYPSQWDLAGVQNRKRP